MNCEDYSGIILDGGLSLTFDAQQLPQNSTRPGRRLEIKGKDECPTAGGVDVAGSLELSDRLYGQFEVILTDLRARTEAECVLLADIEGQLISTRGHAKGIDPLLMASLAAADVMAATELSRQIGGNDSGNTLLHEGKRINVYLFNIADRLVLSILFRSSIPANVIHAQSRQAIDQLRRLAIEIQGRDEQATEQRSFPGREAQETEGQGVKSAMSGLAKTGPTLPDALAEQVEHMLTDLRRLTRAECVLLADVSGQLLGVKGQMLEVDPTLMATLAAADIVATNELIKLIGGGDQGGASLRQGKRMNVYLFDVARRLILVVLVWSNQLTALIHVFGSRTAERMRPIAVALEQWWAKPPRVPGAEFGANLAEEMDRVFEGL